MATIKIKSNPYEKEIKYFSYQKQSGEWKEIQESNPNSKLREDESEKSFLPFRIKEIVDTLLEEYYVDSEKVNIVFEGTQEEYEVLEKVCMMPEMTDKISLTKANVILENAKLILSDTKEIFKTVQPIIEEIMHNDSEVEKDLNKVSDALDDIIPICVFGNYSAGKSTFINSLIGHEILPSGGDPVTAKIYKIELSDSDELARIRFKHWDDEIELIFEGKIFRIRKGKSEDEMLCELARIMEDNDEDDMFRLINRALEFINGYEKIDLDSIEISDLIQVEVPFAKEGVLGRSRNKFVIFDTPGSNSNSNTDHSKVLADALQGFSNGIPVWVSQYETIDSNDNAKLCDDVLNIKALDNRFTMIVLNKADTSDLPEKGFSEKQIRNIREYNAVEKMYASGIYFVSSIMGLGAKNNGRLADKYYRKTYRSQQEMFSDPEDLDYITLYTYNLMPEQIKNEMVKYSKICTQSKTDLIYANSGLFCIEQEMEDFASKYSAYNKCQIIYRKIWKSKPQMTHYEKDYYEAEYIENCEIKKITRCNKLFEFEEIYSHKRLLEICSSNEFMMATWKLIDEKYIGDFDCHLYVITDATEIPIGLLYYHLFNDKFHISGFEVASTMRRLGIGTAIIKQFFNEYKVSSNDIFLEPLNKESEKFWKKLGIKCSLY